MQITVDEQIMGRKNLNMKEELKLYQEMQTRNVYGNTNN